MMEEVIHKHVKEYLSTIQKTSLITIPARKLYKESGCDAFVTETMFGRCMNTLGITKKETKKGRVYIFVTKIEPVNNNIELHLYSF